MSDILKAVLFGIVEGITEWLQVISTGHLILLNRLVTLDVSDEFYSMFQVVIQLGAIMAVVILFWDRLWPFGRRNNRYPLARSGWGAYVKRDIMDMWFHIAVSCLPAAFVGILMDDVLEALFYNYRTVAIMLILFGIAFIVVEEMQRGRRPRITSVRNIDYTCAVVIGLFQLIAAIFPGTSRSGATIVGALLIGISRSAAAEYTFYLAVPVMAGASLLKLLRFNGTLTGMEIAVLGVGMLTAWAVSLFVVRFLMSYIKAKDFKIFGWYRIALGIVVLVCGMLGKI